MIYKYTKAGPDIHFLFYILARAILQIYFAKSSFLTILSLAIACTYAPPPFLFNHWPAKGLTGGFSLSFVSELLWRLHIRVSQGVPLHAPGAPQIKSLEWRGNHATSLCFYTGFISSRLLIRQRILCAFFIALTALRILAQNVSALFSS